MADDDGVVMVRMSDGADGVAVVHEPDPASPRAADDLIRQAATIVVCPLSRVAEMVAQHEVATILSLLGDTGMALTPDGVSHHLVVQVNDIVAAADSMILADTRHIQQVIDFARSWDDSAPMLVHCFAGISRSTASAFIVACVRQPDRDETEIAAELRAASTTASPNRHFVELADRMLHRQGRMVAAIEQIGPGVPAPEGVPFTLSVRPSGTGTRSASAG